MDLRDIRTHSGAVIAGAFAAPLVGAALLGAVRDELTTTTAALVLVVLVVAAASTGVRAAGIVAALSAGAWFDYFLTEPYGSFKVDSADDVQAAVLLLVVGVLVTELALWGRRQQAGASRRAGHLAGVIATADAIARRTDPQTLAHDVAGQIADVLGIEACRYEPGGAASACVLQRDGTVTRFGRVVDVERHGLPTDDVITVEVGEGASRGRFVLTATTSVVRPSLEQRRVVGLLADQVATAMA
ncbi:MAG: DUF4118 domain-containing protein [Brevundimonas sp.]